MALAQLKLQLGALLMLLVLATVGLVLLAAARLESVAASMDTVFKDRVLCLQQLHAIDDAFGRRVPAALAGARDGTLGPKQAAEEVLVARRSAAAQWRAYLQTYLTPEESRLAHAAQAVFDGADATAARAQHLLELNDRPGIEKFAVLELQVSVQPLISAMDGLLNLQVEVSREANAISHASYRETVWMLALLAALTVGLGGLLTWGIFRRYALAAAAHEQSIARLNSFYAALSQTNQLLVTEIDEASLLDETCRIAVETGQARLACIHVLDGQQVRRTAAAGNPMSFYDSFPVTWNLADEGTSNTLISRVIRDGEFAVRQDYRAGLQSNPWAERMLRHGVQSAAAFPIRRGGRIFGALSLYAQDRSFFSADILVLVNEIAGSISFALGNLDRSAELRAAASARASQLSAEMANQAKTAFLSQMSHEVRTPLNAILGFTQLIQRDAGERLAASDLARLDQIRQSGWHLMSLVNDVLDVSRIESGSFAVQVRPMLLGPLLDAALQIGEQLANQAGVSLRPTQQDVPELHVLADAVRLRQVLINLLSNAIKYNRPGGSVQMRIHARADEVDIEVIDTGFGMTAEQLEHLFEPFNRLGRERGGIEGTGIGLVLARQLVGLMGGRLAFESRPGVGTTARVTLERADAAPAGDPVAQAPDWHARAKSSVQGAVLYIEDNEINVMLVEQMLADWRGVRFFHAADGRTGLAMAKALQPELVLLDMNMPDLTGLEVLEQLRREPATQDMRVVVLSASAMAADVERALAAGALDYWTKPLDMDAFLGKLERLLVAATPHSATTGGA